MKSASVLLVSMIGASMLLAANASAQQRAADRNATTTTSSDQLPPVQPPPDMDDKDPVTNAPTPEQVAKTVVDQSINPNDRVMDDAAKRAAANSPGLPPDVQAAADASELPVITVRHDGADTVEEYRKKGKLYFVRVMNTSAPTKFYVDNPSAVPPNMMQQLSGPSGDVQPVYYKLADWK